MVKESQTTEKMQEVLDSVAEGLHGTNFEKFSERAFAEYKRKMGELPRYLTEDTKKQARRHDDDDSISIMHVRHAYESLICGRQKRRMRWTGTFGGFLLGGAVSTFLSMTLGFEYSTVGVAVCLVVGIAGAVMLVLGMRED